MLRQNVVRPLSSVPGIVWLILALHLGVVLWQTAAFPNFRSPDERQHADLVAMVARGEAWPWPAPGTLHLSTGSGAGGFTRSNRIDGPLRLADADIPPRADRPSYTEAGGTTPQPRQPANQLVQHPPLYYLAGAAVLALVPGWDEIPFDRAFLALRWWNAALTAALPLLLWAVARRLRLPEPLPVAAALVPLAIPELTHTESAVNNDNLLLVLCAGLTLLVARVLTGDLRRRTALAAGAVGSLALLTKGFALLVPAWLGLAYLVAAVRTPGSRRRAAGSLAVALLATAPGLAWWLRNKLVYGSVQPHGRYTEMPALTPRYGFADGGTEWAVRLLERLNTLFFVHDQTGDRLHHGPWWMAVVAGATVVAGVAVTLARRSLPAATALVLLFPVAGLLAIVAKGSYEHFAAYGTYGGMQGRHLYGGLAGLVVLAVAAVPRRARRFAPLAVLLFAAAIQAVYLAYTLRLFWLPATGDLGAAVRAVFTWYALPPAVLAAVVAAVVASSVATLVATARLARRPAPPATGDPLPRPPRQPAVARSAAVTALRNSIATVVGPTPPTRGVIAPATSAQDSSTSGSSRRPA